MPQPACPPARKDAGFTLLELLVVLAILGLLASFVAPHVLHQLSGARNSVARQSIARIGTVLDMYKLDVGHYPTTDEGLEALIAPPPGAENWNGPYLKGSSVPADPWKHPYVYRSPSSRAGQDYDLCSEGENNGNGTAQEICNQ